MIWQVYVGVLLLATTSFAAEDHEDVKALDCSAQDTVVRSQYVYEANGPDCSSLIAMPTDLYRMDFRQECQRWQNDASLPQMVDGYFIDYCEQFGNQTTKYRADICCTGSVLMSCFNCQNFTYTNGNGAHDYNCGYQGTVQECSAGQVCQTRVTFHKNTPYRLKSTFCADSAPCTSDNADNNVQCKNYIAAPECNYCCTEPFCNLDTTDPFLNAIDDPCDSNPCLNAGTCSSSIPAWTYTCTCAAGWTGDRCQTNLNPPIYGCNSFPCSNGAWCVNVGTNGDYSCRCKISWGGQNCTEAYGLCADSNYCLNGGTCYDHLGYGLRCDCLPGYVGSLCELETLTCSTPTNHYLRPGSIRSNFQNNNCTKKTLDERENNLGDSYNKDRCKEQMSALSGKPEFQDNIDGTVPELEAQSLYSCAKGDIYAWQQEEACCPTCYNLPCENSAWCTQALDNDYICKCRLGYEGKNCQYRNVMCIINGDPHYKSFDGRSSHFQGECKYLLTESDPSFPFWESFRVIGKNRRGIPPIIQTVSWLEYIEVEIFGYLVRLDQDRKAFVDNVQVTPEVSYDGFTILFNGIYLRLETNFTLVIEFDGDGLAIIKVPPSYSNLVRGICGNYDGSSNNDLTTKEGVDVQNRTNRYSEHAESWREHDLSNPNCTVEDTDVVINCEPSLEDLIESHAYCGLITNVSNVFAACILDPDVNADDSFEDCVFDVCANAPSTDGMDLAKCMSLEAFIAKCEAEGHVIDWRDEANCPFTCPPGFDYEFLGTACPPTCGNPDAPEQCHLPNREGCFCPDPLHVIEDEQCQDPYICGCVDADGSQHSIGDQWLSSDCSILYDCHACTSCTRPVGEIGETPYGCPQDYICEPLGNGYSCELGACPDLECTDPDGTKYCVGFNGLSRNCLWNVTCLACNECIPPIGELDKVPHTCAANERCTNVTIPGQCSLACTVCTCQDHRGKHWEIGEWWLEDDCTYVHTCYLCPTCNEPLVLKEGYSCEDGTTCIDTGGYGDCQAPLAAKDSGWADWTPWTKCGQTESGSWLQFRTRNCQDPDAKCVGDDKQQRACDRKSVKRAIRYGRD